MKNIDNKKVLIVENDEQVLATFQALLDDAGFDTQVTWSGRDALSALESGRFSVILTDGYLPDLHLTGFLERVRDLKGAPMIVVMQNPLPKPTVARRYLGLGAYAVVDKRDQSVVCDAVVACCDGPPRERYTSNRLRMRKRREFGVNSLVRSHPSLTT